ncbi:MAG: 30S ribosomal protein S20 [Candidatus Eremiobacteraeota bacterium]|nr:30S ribosomal protein S20 [Candidatus Eremiobacteraeota bacterium]
MPNIKAADKWVLQSEKRRLRNISTKTRVRTLTKKAAASGDASEASAAESSLDRAAGKGVIHKNKAARKKSRLAKGLRAREAAASAAAVAGTERPGRSGKKR